MIQFLLPSCFLWKGEAPGIVLGVAVAVGVDA